MKRFALIPLIMALAATAGAYTVTIVKQVPRTIKIATAGPQGAQGFRGYSGAQGPVGPTGPQGPQGFRGYSGAIGAASTIPGPPGPPGTDGYTPIKDVDYFDGAASTVPGPPGYSPIKGVDYFDGEQGIQGIQGPPGDPASNVITSVFGRTGAVVKQAGDYTAADVGAIPNVNGSVTLPKMANMSTAHFIGRSTTGNGPPESISPAAAKSLLAIGQADVSGLKVTDSPTFIKILTAAGSATDPAVQLGGTDVGIYSQSSQLRLRANGVLGAVLSNTSLQFGGGEDSAISYVTNTSLKLRGGSTDLWLNATGVGIGSTAPAAKLQVKGSGTTTGVMIQGQDSADAVKFTVLDNGTGTLAGSITAAGGNFGTGDVIAATVSAAQGNQLALGAIENALANRVAVVVNDSVYIRQLSGTNGSLRVAPKVGNNTANMVGTYEVVNISPTYNQGANSTGTNTDFKINRTETAIGSGTQRLISAGTGGGSYVEKFGVSNTGNLRATGVPVYANNAAALVGGLTAGNFYRTGADPDPLCIVH